jgi:hypothetical protein
LPNENLPTLPETAGVLAAVQAFRAAMGLAPGDMVDLPLFLAELKASIERVESVTRSEQLQ